MRFNPAALTLLALALSLTACASASVDYPSLAIRDVERASGTFAPPAAQSIVRPSPSASVLDRIDQLGADAATAHQAFVAAAPATRRVISAASGQEIGSENWSVAQVALAGLEAERSRAMIALADLDRLYVDAGVEGTALDRIAAVRGTVAAQVEEQNATIESLSGGLR